MNLNKKLLTTLLLTIPFCVHAEDAPFPSDTKGVQILPMTKQSLPVAMKNEILAKQKEEKVKGYRYTNQENARYLLNISKNAPLEIKEAKVKNYGVYDTHMKTSYKEIKLSFPFKEISFIPKKDVIGYAAVGQFIKEKNKEGWNGIRQFFNSPELGNCSYEYMGIIAVQLSEETTEYSVNKKPTTKVIEGNQNSGFLYTLNWYTDNSMSTLECANKKFEPKIMTQMISLANQIDKR